MASHVMLVTCVFAVIALSYARSFSVPDQINELVQPLAIQNDVTEERSLLVRDEDVPPHFDLGGSSQQASGAFSRRADPLLQCPPPDVRPSGFFLEEGQCCCCTEAECEATTGHTCASPSTEVGCNSPLQEEEPEVEDPKEEEVSKQQDLDEQQDSSVPKKDDESEDAYEQTTTTTTTTVHDTTFVTVSNCYLPFASGYCCCYDPRQRMYYTRLGHCVSWEPVSDGSYLVTRDWELACERVPPFYLHSSHMVAETMGQNDAFVFVGPLDRCDSDVAISSRRDICLHLQRLYHLSVDHQKVRLFLSDTSGKFLTECVPEQYLNGPFAAWLDRVTIASNDDPETIGSYVKSLGTQHVFLFVVASSINSKKDVAPGVLAGSHLVSSSKSGSKSKESVTWRSLIVVVQAPPPPFSAKYNFWAGTKIPAHTISLSAPDRVVKQFVPELLAGEPSQCQPSAAITVDELLDRFDRACAAAIPQAYGGESLKVDEDERCVAESSVDGALSLWSVLPCSSSGVPLVKMPHSVVYTAVPVPERVYYE
eukprot:gnl/Spiro4/3380_TR1641_c0_g1_i1.p1 gnl/Spiro4/3380_TR1641_c0_g1~~gnl/Spiro4/3380_TR1641_c0_g1_i1.p1  ORF type:complete len:547 (+),score=86.29 gnl/Spiro4/3380_TR1641_c0_g1_i1:31-1641(+)